MITATQDKIPAGYKQTEVGVIPKDWEIKPLTNIADVRDGTHESPRYYKEGVMFVTSKNIVNGKLDLTEVTYISESDAASINKRSKVDKGDILMSMIGTVGNSVLINSEPNFCIKNVALFKRLSANANYLIQLFNSPKFQSYLDARLAGGIQKFIGLGNIRELLIPLPATEEERNTIASVLADADALIEGLRKLIAKKRAVREGAMQELLTGKRRLPGFKGEWDAPVLGDLFSFKNGLNKAKKFFGYGTPIVNYMDVYRKRGLTVRELAGRVSLSKDELAAFQVRKGDVFFTRTSETAEEVGLTSVMLDKPYDTVFSGFVLRARPKDNSMDDQFKKYCFSTSTVRRQIISQSTETTRALTNGRYLSVVSIARPPKLEQKVIAEVLSDMDFEINTLEQKLAKYKALKQGMMQMLLTGKIRLPH
jgi:type I restriction enzyme S subunit